MDDLATRVEDTKNRNSDQHRRALSKMRRELDTVANLAMALPHLIGAPQPARIGGPVPPELAGHFVAASLVTAAIFWCALGWLSGTFWQRLGAR